MTAFQCYMGTRMNDDNWKAGFRAALKKRNPQRTIEVLDAMQTAHSGTPPSAVKDEALVLLQSDDDVLWWASSLASMKTPTARELACGLLPMLYCRRPRRALRLLLPVLDDPHWEVREYGAASLSKMLAADFSAAPEIVRSLASDPRANLHRGAVVALKYVARERISSWEATLFELVELFIMKRDPYVRRNLGQFALGDGFLRYYPTGTLRRLRRWVKSDHEVVRWNVAMCLSAAEARKHMDVALKILDTLAADDRRFVWRAVASAIKNHARAGNPAVIEAISAWKEDERRRPVAQVATKYLRS